MGKFDGLLICSDFDGTLYWKGNLSDVNREAVRYFREEGGAFTISTGRYPISLFHLVDRELLLPTPLIGLNGGLLYDGSQDKVLYYDTMPEDYRSVLADVLAHREILDVSLYPVMKEMPLAFRSDQREEMLQASLRPLVKILIHLDADISDEVKDELTERLGASFLVTRSWINGVEIQGAAYDKGTTSRKLANMLGADKLICVGDYENDLSMIREADIGVAMGNAVEALKAEADLITDTAEEHGVAKLIYSL